MNKCGVFGPSAAILLALLACKRSESNPSPDPGTTSQAAEVESAKAAANEAKKEAAEAKQQVADMQAAADKKAAAARLAKARADAPSKVTVQQMGCFCAKGKQIVVTCRVTNRASVHVSVVVNASAATGIMGVRSTGGDTVPLDPGAMTDRQIVTLFHGLVDCGSASNCACAKGEVTPGPSRPAME